MIDRQSKICDVFTGRHVTDLLTYLDLLVESIIIWSRIFRIFASYSLRSIEQAIVGVSIKIFKYLVQISNIEEETDFIFFDNMRIVKYLLFSSTVLLVFFFSINFIYEEVFGIVGM